LYTYQMTNPLIGIWITKTLLAIIAVCMLECFNNKCS
jgi:hypothetical protein